jgi:Serine dehydrogenase proteinase
MKKKPDEGPPPWSDAAQTVADETKSDIYLFSGTTGTPADYQFNALVQDSKSRPNAMLLLTTYGGNPHAAYRMARCLQRAYPNGKVTVFVDSICKSAGTLIAVGADEIVMSDWAELGPLDIQVPKDNEVGDMSSGLTPSQTFDVLKSTAFDLFQDHFKKLRDKVGFSTQLSASVATRMVVGLVGRIYAQVTPMKLGEIARSVMITQEYGERLSRSTDNLKPDALPRLLANYPTHGFVIDREETESLFSDVRPPSPAEKALCLALAERVAKGLENSATGDPAVVLSVSVKLATESDDYVPDGTKLDSIEQESGVVPPAPVEDAVGTSGSNGEGSGKKSEPIGAGAVATENGQG